MIDEARAKGCVATAFGNRRHVHDQILHKDDGMRGHVERQVVNYLIQGVCADNLKRTLTEIRKQGLFKKHNATLIAPIYDELAFSCHHSQAADLILAVHKIMTRDIPGMAVPMLAEPSLGVNFGDQIEIGPFPTKELVENAVDEALGRSMKKAA